MMVCCFAEICPIFVIISQHLQSSSKVLQLVGVHLVVRLSMSGVLNPTFCCFAETHNTIMDLGVTNNERLAQQIINPNLNQGNNDLPHAPPDDKPAQQLPQVPNASGPEQQHANGPDNQPAPQPQPQPQPQVAEDDDDIIYLDRDYSSSSSHNQSRKRKPIPAEDEKKSGLAKKKRKFARAAPTSWWPVQEIVDCRRDEHGKYRFKVRPRVFLIFLTMFQIAWAPTWQGETDLGRCDAQAVAAWKALRA